MTAISCRHLTLQPAMGLCLIDAGAALLERFRSAASEIGVDDLAALDACERSVVQARERFVGSSS